MNRLMGWRRWAVVGGVGLALAGALVFLAARVQAARAPRIDVAAGNAFQGWLASAGQVTKGGLGCCAAGSKIPMVGCGASKAPAGAAPTGATSQAEQAARQRWESQGGDPSATFKVLDYGCHTEVQVFVGGKRARSYLYIPGLGISDNE